MGLFFAISLVLPSVLAAQDDSDVDSSSPGVHPMFAASSRKTSTVGVASSWMKRCSTGEIKSLPQLWDAPGAYYPTREGAKIYWEDARAYHTWQAYSYKVPPTLPIRSSYELLSISETNTEVQISDTATFTLVDAAGDGVFERLIVDFDVEILSPGFYAVEGTLTKNGEYVSSRHRYAYMHRTSDEIGNQPGTHTARLIFSGEEILHSGEDGPYELSVSASGQTLAKKTILTPAYDHTRFGEYDAVLTGVSAVPVDTDGDGRYNFIALSIDVKIFSPDEYFIQGAMGPGSETIAFASDTKVLGVGEQTVTLKLPGVSILRSGKDGPYAGLVSISKATGEHQDSIEFTTQTYNHLDFEGILDLDGTVTDQGVDTNGNGLYDVLRVNFGADIRSAGTFSVLAKLQTSMDGQLVGYADTLVTLDEGQQTLTIDFSGPEINTQGIDGPCEIVLTVYDAKTDEEIE